MNQLDVVVMLHSHLPYVLNHGRWPHGSDWICEAALETYLPLLEVLRGLSADAAPSSVPLGPDLLAAFRAPEAPGRIEIISSAATHGYLPLLARDESIRLQLAVGVS